MKKIYTIQSSDKYKFDEQVNIFLEIGCWLLENSYKVIENDDGVIYSQVVEYDTQSTYIKLYDNGKLLFSGKGNGNEKDGFQVYWYENGNKMSEVIKNNYNEMSRREWNKDGSEKK